MSFLETYYQMQRDAETEFRTKDVVVLMQKGDFMQCFDPDPDERRNLARRVARALNSTLTRTNKSQDPGPANPFMVGFPTAAKHKNVPVLLMHQYTVVWVEQVWCPVLKKVVGRKRTRVYTPGTFYDDESSGECKGEAAPCVTAMIAVSSTCLRLATYNACTGAVALFALDSTEQLVWFAHVHSSRELVVPENCPDAVIEPFGNLLAVRRKTPQRDFFSGPVQTHTLRAVYTDAQIEDMDASFVPVVALLIHFVHHVCGVDREDIGFPSRDPASCDRMEFFGRAVLDLNMDLLFKKLDFTKTAMGRRHLRTLVMSPMTDPETIRADLDAVARCCVASASLRNVRSALGLLPDPTRQLRRVTKSPDGARVLELWDTMTKLQSIADECRPFLPFLKTVPIFDAQKLFDGTFDRTRDPWFVRCGHDDRFDALVDELRDIRQAVDAEIAAQVFNRGCKTEILDDGSVAVTTTKKRASELAAREKKVRSCALNSSTWKVSTAALDNLSDRHANVMQTTKARAATIFETWKTQTLLSPECDSNVQALIRAVTVIDTLLSRARCAEEYELVKPTVTSAAASFCRAECLFHPLLDACERRVGNPVDTHTDAKGTLIFGVNGSGKTTYAKSIALNVALAQSGHFVFAEPETEFVLSPYRTIFTRVDCADDITLGRSSFAVEMTETRGILRHADEHSLVIGDEPCRSTESVSATALVAAFVHTLAHRGATFFVSTHLHALTKVSVVRDLVPDRVRFAKMQSSFDRDLNTVVYDRKVLFDVGIDDTKDLVYGLEIARDILNLPDFSLLASTVRNEIVPRVASEIRRSRYNAKVAVSQCTRCRSVDGPLHTHHIVEQQTFNHKRRKVMNHESNLVVLCEDCHTRVHAGEIRLRTQDTPVGFTVTFD